MFRPKKRLALSLLAVMAAGFALPEDAEARRYRRAVVRGPVVYRAPVYRAYRAPVRVRAPYVGVTAGRWGGVSVAAPGVRVGVGW